MCVMVMLGACNLQVSGPPDSSNADPESSTEPKDPNTAARAVVDRFGASAATMFLRDETNGFPGPNDPVDFDQPPFLSRGLGPEGESVRYYNFDVQPTASIPIFVLTREGETGSVPGQPNIVDLIPGDVGYGDFWQMHMVTVPGDYVANTITSLEAITAAGFAIEPTNMIVNCPIVPDGSTAALRMDGASPDLVQGWYRDQIITYFTFVEKLITVDVPETGSVNVPLADVFVSFNINPGETGGGPTSGPMLEPNTDQSHSVFSALPADLGYSPLWIVNVYDNADFDDVRDFATAQSANLIAAEAMIVNCPIVEIEDPS